LDLFQSINDVDDDGGRAAYLVQPTPRKARASYDIHHRVSSDILPFGRGKRYHNGRITNAVLGGWELMYGQISDRTSIHGRIRRNHEPLSSWKPGHTDRA
jgi:hypothetical protein